MFCSSGLNTTTPNFFFSFQCIYTKQMVFLEVQLSKDSNILSVFIGCSLLLITRKSYTNFLVSLKRQSSGPAEISDVNITGFLLSSFSALHLELDLQNMFLNSDIFPQEHIRHFKIQRNICIKNKKKKKNFHMWPKPRFHYKTSETEAFIAQPSFKSQSDNTISSNNSHVLP